MSLTFKELSEANKKRCEQVFHPLKSWSETDWACAQFGECGELIQEILKFVSKTLIVGDTIKKYRRGLDNDKFSKKSLKEIKEDLGKECADVLLYLDLLTQRFDLDLGEEVVKKFNEVSKKRNSTIFLKK